MARLADCLDSIRSIQIRKIFSEIVGIGVLLTSALILWTGLIFVTGSDSPIVVVLSGSMEPGFQKGDILFLHMRQDPIRTGEIVVFEIEGRDIPIVHRVIEVHEHQDSREVDILTKGDNNPIDDRNLYASGQLWVQRHHIKGRAVGFFSQIMTGFYHILAGLQSSSEKPIVKYLLFGALGLMAIASKE